MLFTLVTKGKLDIDTAAEEAGVIYQNVNSKNPLTIVLGIADFLCFLMCFTPTPEEVPS